MTDYSGKIREKSRSNVIKRRKLGAALCGAGVFFNLLLFLIKLIAGTRSGSIAVTADAYNNLADASASLLSMTGFLLSSKKPSRRFPYGYGRIEYLSGLFLSTAVVIVGIRLFISSVEKLMHPQAVESSPLVIILLLVSIAVKCLMFLYNRHYAKALSSSVMKAAAADSLSDCIATLTILGSIAVRRFFSLNIDSVCSIAVSVCILYAGLSSSKDSALPLLGCVYDEKTAIKIRMIASRLDPHIRIESVSCHDYGPYSKIVCIALRICGDERVDCDALKEAVDRELCVRSSVYLLPTSLKKFSQTE